MRWFNSLVVAALPCIPVKIVGLFAKRYIAGEDLSQAIQEVKKLNDTDAMTTVDLLGEFISEESKAIATMETYLEILDNINKHKLDSNVSLKPTSFGASFDPELCRKNIEKVLKQAVEMKNFVRIDMEDHPYTDLTLDMYKEFREKYPESIGTVLQSYLKRTYQDADQLSKNSKANLRLCKGIYDEPEEIAYKKYAEINESYLQTLDLLFSRGAYVGIATHDDALVAGVLELIKKYKLDNTKYEFQMLLGVKSDLRNKLIAQGHRMRVYTPYGKDWYRYSIRRLKENPTIIGSMMRGFFQR